MKSSSRPADDELDRLVALGITRQQVESGDDCLDPEVLASYADGGLSVAERVEADAHLARCRDCRRALALQIESDPLVASNLAVTAASASAVAPGDAESAAGESGVTESAVTTTTGPRGTAGRPRIVKFANTWLPLAAALVVSIGLWFAFNRPRQGAPDLTSESAQLSARNEFSAAKQAAAQTKEEEIDRLRKSSDDPAQPGSDDRVQPRSADSDAPPSEVPPREAPLRDAPLGRADAPAAQSPASAPASASARARESLREEFAAAARPNVEADGRTRRGAVAPAPAPTPPPLEAALAGAAPARVGGAAGAGGQQARAGGQEAQTKAAGQLAVSAPPPAAAPQAPASASAPAQAPAPVQTNAANQANQNVAQQQAINQQTGPMSNLNVAPPPAPKTDERRQVADASKVDTNEKTGGGPSGASGAKSADTKSTKAEQAESKSLARAKAAPAPESAAGTAPVDAASTKNANAASGKSAGDTSAREINEAVTVSGPAPANARMLQLRSADGAHWWRIPAPGTIEGSTDRGATWTVEYSEPSMHLVTGAVAAKGDCWMIGRNGLVLRTRPNGGWERVTQPTTRNLERLTVTDHLIATVTDDQRRTYRTTDGGATWR